MGGLDAGKVNLPFPADTTARGQRGTEGGGRPTNPREDSAKLVNEDKLIDQGERHNGYTPELRGGWYNAVIQFQR